MFGWDAVKEAHPLTEAILTDGTQCILSVGPYVLKDGVWLPEPYSAPLLYARGVVAFRKVVPSSKAEWVDRATTIYHRLPQMTLASPSERLGMVFDWLVDE